MQTKKKEIRKIFIVSDTHFGHRMLIDKGHRPVDFESRIFHSLAEISENDLLIHLGDVCLGKNEEQHNKYIQNIQAKKILIRGNHDNKSDNWYYNHGWDFVCSSFTGKYFGKYIEFSHEPRLKTLEKTQYNIHGHFHDNVNKDKEYYPFYDPKYHKEFALEKTNYKPVLLKTFLDFKN